MSVCGDDELAGDTEAVFGSAQAALADLLLGGLGVELGHADRALGQTRLDRRRSGRPPGAQSGP